MNKYTIDQFQRDYPNNDKCLDKLFKLRFENLVCPKCDNDNPFTRVKNRMSYQCPSCGFQVYPCKGTIFEKSTTPLTYWFMAIYLQTTTRNGVAARELVRQMDICYKTALRMAHQIKILMAKNNIKKVSGEVEIDEGYINVLNREKNDSMEESDRKRGIMGFISRDGNVKMQVMHGGKSFKDRVRENVTKDSTVITDGHLGYVGLNIEYYKHEIVNHSSGEYVRGKWHIQKVENFWSIFKRTIRGTHLSVSERHLQKYVDEVAFRYMHRDNQAMMFENVLKNIV